MSSALNTNYQDILQWETGKQMVKIHNLAWSYHRSKWRTTWKIGSYL